MHHSVESVQRPMACCKSHLVCSNKEDVRNSVSEMLDSSHHPTLKGLAAPCLEAILSGAAHLKVWHYGNLLHKRLLHWSFHRPNTIRPALWLRAALFVMKPLPHLYTSFKQANVPLLADAQEGRLMVQLPSNLFHTRLPITLPAGPHADCPFLDQ